MCHDYTDANANHRVFNASKFIRRLRGQEFQCFEQQIFLADVCGNYTPLNFELSQREAGRPVTTVEQMTYFATPEGKYAKGDNGLGVFTSTTVSVLRKFNTWPNLKEFSSSMGNAFESVGETPFCIEWLGDPNNKEKRRLVGSFPTDSESLHFKSVLSILSPLNLSNQVFRRHYQRTVSNLGEPKMNAAQGLSGMIKELTSMRDGDLHGGLPFGLIQFLSRLCQEDEVAEVIETWLDANAAQQGSDRSSVKEIISAETAEKLLVIEVINNDEGRISEFQPYLRTQNLRPIDDERLLGQKVNDWADFETKIVALINNLRNPPTISGVQIYFLVDPPLFDRPFHMILIRPGTMLGEEYAVLLRNRERVRFARDILCKPWKQYADSLHQTSLGDLKFIPIPAPTGDKVKVPDEMGICYAAFVVPPLLSGGVDSHEKHFMGKLMRVGVPYLYWLHRIPTGGNLANVEESLNNWFRGLKTLEEFPGVFTSQRNVNEYALQASLLWDDPRFNPFSMSEVTGVQ